MGFQKYEDAWYADAGNELNVSFQTVRTIDKKGAVCAVYNRLQNSVLGVECEEEHQFFCEYTSKLFILNDIVSSQRFTSVLFLVS